MKFSLFIETEREEEVIVYAHRESELTESIKDLVSGTNNNLVGYKNNELVKINLENVYCFTIENNKLYAVMEKEKLLIKQRLYQIEEMLGSKYIKINQSSIANINFIDRFDASIGGTLTVIFKNKYKDYVSRRQIKEVKKRMGI